MADEDQGANAQPKPAGGGVVKYLAMVAIVLVAAGGGYLTYAMVLSPMLAPTAEGDQEDEARSIPVNPVPYELPQSYANVIREDAEPSSTLAYKVTIECANPETYALIDKHRARFIDMINKLHDGRTRSELDNTLLIKESIQRQALQKSNQLLKQLQENGSNELQVTSVFHEQFFVQDPL